MQIRIPVHLGGGDADVLILTEEEEAIATKIQDSTELSEILTGFYVSRKTKGVK